MPASSRSGVSKLKQLEVMGTLAGRKPLEKESVAVVHRFLKNATETEIHEALDVFFDSQDIYSDIDDVRLFSRRIVEEASAGESTIHEFSRAQLSFSLKPTFPEIPHNHFSVNGREPIYAHINIDGGPGAGDAKLFTRWVNLDTGEILLFKQKRVLSGHNKNWISYTPDNPWEAGSYEVSFYQFNSALNKLVSEMFFIEN